jgi:hypothetical protein
MRANLETAHQGAESASHVPNDRSGHPEADDPRKGYPTPTVLLAGRDVFDNAGTNPPFPEPT